MLFSSLTYNELERFCFVERGHLEAEGEMLNRVASRIDELESELKEKRAKLAKISELAFDESDA